MLLYPEDSPELLEFERIREAIAQHCRTTGSRKLALETGPLEDTELVITLLHQAEEYKTVLEHRGSFPDTRFDEFEIETQLLRMEGSVLSEMQFSRIRSASEITNTLVKFLSERTSIFPYLNKLTSGIPITLAIIEAIDQVIDAHAQVKSNASPELQDIRERLILSRREADKRFRNYLNLLKKKGYLRENEENFYNNRRVLAVPSEYKREIRGLIHGKSDSGKTIFIEPEAMVELNNIIAELEQDERQEIYRLLRMLTETLHGHQLLINSYHRFLTGLDLVRAKALFAIDIRANIPQVNQHSYIRLINAYHPLLYLQNHASGLEVVPLNLELNDKQRIIIISGPNAGGKSITLKTVGLLQLMFQSGLLIPAAEGSSMGFFNHFLADIGDSQSIENALSTYSSRLIRMNYFLRMAGERSLILIDEFGTGTDPELGGAIAEAVLEELNEKKVFGIFTTHYTNIKLLADHLPGVRNASMLFDPATLQPRYQLITGQPGSSYTFEVAERIGLPQPVLERAKTKVRQEKLNLNNMLAGLQAEKNAMDTELRQLRDAQSVAKDATEKYETLRKQLGARIETEREKISELKKYSILGRKLEAWADEWEKTKDKKVVIKKFVSSMMIEKKKRAAEKSPDKLEKKRLELIERLKKVIHTGSKVRMLKGRQVGTVEEIRKNIVYVNFGNIRAAVAMENLEIVE